jgi:Fic family protein
MMRFLDGLDHDLHAALLAQLRDLWTHTSTALEGNTLTLGETAFVLAEGLTVSGKPLKDHQEVTGHARAIELLYELLQRDTTVTDQDLFNLHRAVQTGIVHDIYAPVGGWKREPNGTHAMTPDGRQTFIDYASPADTPALMSGWLDALNRSLSKPLTEDDALVAYADLHLGLVRVHPFFDGNGRMARLLANLPVLKAGFPPILIDGTRRQEYLRLLSGYDLKAGQAQTGLPLLSTPPDAFRAFCRECWQASLDLVAEAHRRQEQRGRPLSNP